MEVRIDKSVTKTSGYAIAAFILGIGGLLVFPLVLSIAAIIVAGKAREEIGRDTDITGDGLATAGLVLGWVGVVVGLIEVIVLIVFLAAFF